MGDGGWSVDSYASAKNMRAKTGTPTFAYSDTTMKSKPRTEWQAHEDLAATRTNKKGLNAGKNVREALDSDEHPTSLPIAVLFDVTGSMMKVPQLMVDKLPELWGLLLRKGYVEHPQVMFGAIGDANSDQVPLQVGQFESDNRSDEDLGKIFLEGNGGGSSQESYELAMYFMARHTQLDSFEKRGHKGYLFIIGDEQPYDEVDPDQVQEIIGDDIGQPISTKEIAAELKQKFDVYILRPHGGSYPASGRGSEIVNHWKQLFGDNVLEVQDDSTVSETIAVTIGLAEGKLGNLDEGLADLHEIGAGDAVAAVSKALATVGPGGGIITSDSPDLSGDDGVDRL